MSRKPVNSNVVTLRPATEEFGETREDGIFVSNAQLERFFKGDIKQARRYFRLAMADARPRDPIVGPTKKPEGVRPAKPEDEQAIFDLLMMDLQESHANRMGVVSPDRVWEHVRRSTRREVRQYLPDGRIVAIPTADGAAVIDGPDGKPVAVVIWNFDQGWWTNNWHISEVTNFVHPDHRKSRHAETLIDYVKWLADGMSVQNGYQMRVVLGVLGIKRSKDKVRLYNRRATMAGGVFIYPWPGE